MRDRDIIYRWCKRQRNKKIKRWIECERDRERDREREKDM